MKSVRLRVVKKRPAKSARRVLRTAAKSKQPLVARKDWHWLPLWIALHAERGKQAKCWEGHRMLKDTYDARSENICIWCEKYPENASPILVCRKCNWTVCATCQRRPRLQALHEDPLFHGPDCPGLLASSTGTPIDPDSRGTVIVCPGGNYEFLVPHEGFPPVDWLAGHGIRAFVLRYRLLPKHDFGDMLDDLRCAVEEARQTFAGPVAAMGFSAGGHLVASLGLRKRMKGKKVQPLDAQVLVYPCIDGSDWVDPDSCGFFDFQSCFRAARSTLVGRQALLGGPGFSAPPTLLVASTVDGASPPKDHTDKYARALKQHNVPYTYLRRDFGPHGFGITGGWTDTCIKWLRSKGFGVAKP